MDPIHRDPHTSPVQEPPVLEPPVQEPPVLENWFEKLGEAPHAWMRSSGGQLMALLLQYNSRVEGGEIYLVEGKRIAGEVGQWCARSGLSLPETLQVFLPFRRSILEAIFTTGHLGGCEDADGQRLFQRTNDFLDALMLNLIGSFHENQPVE